LILLSSEPAVLACHFEELTVSTNPGKLRRELTVSHFVWDKMAHGKLKRKWQSHTKEPSNIGLPSES
jgi:hypothetical protein